MRAMDILEAMKDKNKSYSVAELSAALNLPASTVHRILSTFCRRNYVSKDQKTHLYKLGPSLIPLGMCASYDLKLKDEALPLLKEISRKTGEDAFLIIKAGYNGLVLAKAEGPKNLKIVEKFGYEINLNRGAIRKALLAYQSREFIDDFLKYMKKETKDFNSEKLLQELVQIRKNKVAVTCGNYIQNSIGVGSPVFDYQGAVIASLGIIAPEPEEISKKLQEWQQLIIETAHTLSLRMGYQKNNIRN